MAGYSPRQIVLIVISVLIAGSAVGIGLATLVERYFVRTALTPVTDIASMGQ